MSLAARAVARLKILSLAAYQWFGPVAGAIRGELLKEERRRALIKGIMYGLGAKGGIDATVHNPSFQADFLLPMAIAVTIAILEMISRKQQGVNPACPFCSPKTDR